MRHLAKGRKERSKFCAHVSEPQIFLYLLGSAELKKNYMKVDFLSSSKLMLISEEDESEPKTMTFWSPYYLICSTLK